MNGLSQALQFLTILRFNKPDFFADSEKLGSSTIYFSLVGAILGLLLIFLNKLLFSLFPEPLLSSILVITLFILSGALHLDGWADTCDALFSGKDKEKMLDIMRDSHKGTFGVLGIIAVVLLKIGLLSSIPGNFKNLGLFLMAALSRYGMSLAICFFPYARAQGKAKVFFEKASLKVFALSTLITLLILGMTMKWISITTLFLVMAFTFILGAAIERKIGGLTGDTLGALSELNELAVLLFVFIFTKFYS